MATYTSNYGWTKPSGSDNVDIGVLNNNLDGQDGVIHDAFLNMAPPFSESSTYAVDDIVLHGTGLYKCHTAVVTPGSWTGSTNWQVYKLSEGGSGGGGTSNYNDLTNKPSINGVTLTGNKTTSDLSLQDKMQYSTMPTASADNEGKIYQYVGTTDANYTNGYYYKCVENNASYSWQLVENIKEQTPTFSQASTRNNIASGDKLSVILGKVQKFFNDLKTVAFSGSFSDLSNKPENANTFQGTIAEWNQLTTAEKKAYDHASITDSLDGNVTFPANKVVMTGGGNVEDKINGIFTVKEAAKTITTNGNGILPISSEFNLDLNKCIVTSIHIDGQYKFELYNTFNNNDRKLNIAVLGAATDAYYRIKNTNVPVLIRYIEWN